MSFKQLSPLELRDLINKYHSDLRKLHYQVVKTQAMVAELEGLAAEAEKALGLELSIESLVTPNLEAAAPAPEPAEEAPAPKAPAKKTPAKKAPAAKPKRRGRPAGSKNKTAASKTEKASTEKAPAKKTPEAKPKRRGRPAGSKNKATKPAPKKTAEKKPTEKKAQGYRLSEWDNFIIDSLKNKQKVLTTSDLTELGVASDTIKLGAAQIKTKLNASLHKLANKKALLAKVEHSGRGFAYALQEWVSKSGELPKKYVG